MPVWVQNLFGWNWRACLTVCRYRARLGLPWLWLVALWPKAFLIRPIMVRLVLRWLDSPWAFELMPGLNKLGRNPTNDFRIADPSVSSFHAELVVEEELIRVRDLGSTNGTFIDERRVEEWVLKPSDILRLGNVRMQLEEVVVTPASALTHSPAPAEAAGNPREGSSPSAPDARRVSPVCAYHPELQASFRCQNCGGAFCINCIKVVGHDRSGATTVCPLCHGQCDELFVSAPKEKSPSLLNRLTQTLKIPFMR